MQISKYANKPIKILGIDYGRKKIGLAISEGSLAEPWRVVRGEDLVRKIKEIIEKENFDKIIVGVSEGKMGGETMEFLSAVSNQLSTIKFETFDETLTSQDAQRLSIEAGVKRTKRHDLEDAYAACLMLQGYLDLQKRK